MFCSFFVVIALADGIDTLFTQSTEPISIARLQFANILQAIIMESPWKRHFVRLKTSRSSPELHNCIVKTLEKIGNIGGSWVGASDWD